MTAVPLKAPRATLPDGREIAVCIVHDVFIGKFIGVASKQQDGNYAVLSGGGEQYAVLDPNQFDAEVVAAGGAAKWLEVVGIPRVNQILAANYTVDTTSVTYKLNDVLGQCTLSVKNGVPGFY